MLKHKLESWNRTGLGEGEWKQFIGNLFFIYFCLLIHNGTKFDDLGYP